MLPHCATACNIIVRMEASKSKDPQGAVDPGSQEQVRKRVEQADKLFKGSTISFLTTWADQRGIPTKKPDGKSKDDAGFLGDYLHAVDKELFQGGWY